MSDVPERPGRVRGSTRSVGVLGWPVDHSLSPVIHNAAFVALGLDWVYVPLPVAPAELPAALEGLGALGFAGANVTMPHKTSTAELIDDLSEDARLLRAVNTIVVGADGLVGHNSDAAGFERFLRDDAGFDATGRSALLFGAGGGARACALAAARSGLADLSVAVREASRADDLRAALEGSATAVHLVGFDDVPGGRGRPDRQRDAARCPRRGAARSRRCTPASSGWTSSTVPAPLRSRRRFAMRAAPRSGVSGSCCSRPRSPSSCGPGGRRRSR